MKRFRFLSDYQLLPLSIQFFIWTPELGCALFSSLLQYQILFLQLRGVFRTMTVIYDGSQSYMFKRDLDTNLQLYLFHALSLKKFEGKPYQYQSAQCFFSEYTYVKHIPDSIQLSPKQTKLNTYTYQKLLQTKHFCNVFPTNTSLFHPSFMSFFDQNFIFLLKGLYLS